VVGWAGAAAGDGGNKSAVAAVAAPPHSPICFRDCFAFVALIFHHPPLTSLKRGAIFVKPSIKQPKPMVSP
jgi:hypothetical protein